MVNNILHIAKGSIPPFNGSDVVMFKNGNTSDIITTIEQAHPYAISELQQFASKLQGSPLQKCKDIYWLLWNNINYKTDPLGWQFVLKPSALWNNKQGDCKSFSLFIAGCLENLNIPYEFKYVTYTRDLNQVTHVYIVAYPDGKRVVMDVVWGKRTKRFDSEKKPYYFNIIKPSKLMAEIHLVGSIGRTKKPRKIKTALNSAKESFISRKKKKPVISYGPKPLHEQTSGETDLHIIKDRLKTEQKVVAKKGRLYKAQKYQDAIDLINDAIYGIGRVPDLEKEYQLIALQSINGEYSLTDAIHGIGAIGDAKAIAKIRRENRIKRAQWRLAQHKAKNYPTPEQLGDAEIGKFLRKLAQKVKSGVKAVAKFVPAVKIIQKASQFVSKPLANVAKKVAQTAGKAVKTIAKSGKNLVVAAATTTGRLTKVAVTAPVRLLSKKGRAGLKKDLSIAKKSAKNVVKSVVNIATAPAQAVLSTIMESLLPKSAPFFLYMFITDPNLIAKLPPKVATKRKKSEKIANIIMKVTGITRDQFMGICRNGIMKKYSKSPESVIAEQMKGLAGIGLIDDIIGVVIKLVKAVVKLVKDKKDKAEANVTADDAPSNDDWISNSITTASNFKNMVQSNSSQSQSQSQPQSYQAEYNNTVTPSEIKRQSTAQPILNQFATTNNNSSEATYDTGATAQRKMTSIC